MAAGSSSGVVAGRLRHSASTAVYNAVWCEFDSSPSFYFCLSWRQKIGINNKIIVIIVVQIIIINAVIVIIRAIFIIIVIAFNGSSINGFCVCTSAGADLYDISTGCISPLLPRTCRCHDL